MQWWYFSSNTFLILKKTENIIRGKIILLWQKKESRNLSVLEAQWISDDSKNCTVVQLRKHYTLKFGHRENRTKVLGNLLLSLFRLWDWAWLTRKDGDLTSLTMTWLRGWGWWGQKGILGCVSVVRAGKAFLRWPLLCFFLVKTGNNRFWILKWY